MRNVRVWFTKLGRARFISHLDINRCMGRAVRRAKIPLWYTEGFNPHPYMTFSLPLSLGIESLCESMDIRIEGEMDDAEIKQRLNEAMPEGIAVLRAEEPKHKAKDIAFAVYKITVPVTCAEEAAAKLKDTLESGELLAEKKAKQGRKRVVRQVNLSEYVDSCEVAIEEKQVVLHLVLLAGSVKNVNPILLMDTVMEKAGLAADVRLLREALLLEDKCKFA